MNRLITERRFDERVARARRAIREGRDAKAGMILLAIAKELMTSDTHEFVVTVDHDPKEFETSRCY